MCKFLHYLLPLNPFYYSFDIIIGIIYVSLHDIQSINIKTYPKLRRFLIETRQFHHHSSIILIPRLHQHFFDFLLHSPRVYLKSFIIMLHEVFKVTSQQ